MDFQQDEGGWTKKKPPRVAVNYAQVVTLILAIAVVVLIIARRHTKRSAKS